MIYGILVTFGAIFLFRIFLLFASRYSNRSFNEVVSFLRSDQPEQLEELLDRALEASLEVNLSSRQFRREQMRRIRLAYECIDRRTHNVTVFQEWADTELGKTRVTFNREVRTAADKLVIRCAEFRMGASAIKFQLNLWYLKMRFLPSGRVPHISRLRRTDSFDLLGSYDEIKQAALNLAEVCGGEGYEKL